MELQELHEEEVKSEPRLEMYRATVERITRYLDGLPGGARQAWQEAAYHSYLADKLGR